VAESNLIVTTDNFSEAIDMDVPILIDFWAEWCTPCRLVAPVLDEIAQEHPGKIRIGKLNVDENPSLAAENDVMSIPTMILFQHGKEQRRIVGARPKHAMVAELSQYLR
jgi:thioredoxin 1